MYIAVSPMEERLIFEALIKLFKTKNTKIKPKLVLSGRSVRNSLSIRSLDDAPIAENFEYFCKILGLRRERLKFFDCGIGNSVIFALTHNVVRMYAVQNFGKDSVVREFEKGVKSIYPMTSKIKDYVHESTVDCPSVERFLASLSVPFKILSKSEFFADIKFKSITVSISSISKQNSKLSLQYSGV